MTKPRDSTAKLREQPSPKARPEGPTTTIRDQLADIARRGGLPLSRVVEEHAERAAIREYLGGMPREEAEAAAVGDTCDVLGVPR